MPLLTSHSLAIAFSRSMQMSRVRVIIVHLEPE
jgi:hypothetical protein